MNTSTCCCLYCLGKPSCVEPECPCHTPTPVKEEKKCSHIPTGVVYTSLPPQYKCKKCGVMYFEPTSPTEEECTCTTYKLGDSSTFKVTLGECKIHGAVSHAKPPHTQEEWQIRLEELAIKGCRKEELEAFIRKVREEARNTTLDEVSDIAEEMKFTYGCGGNSTDCGAAIPNQALDDLLQHIKDLRK